MFPLSNSLIQRQIIVIISNLVLLTVIDEDALKSLIIEAFPICPIDSMFLLHNCQTKYRLKFSQKEKDNIYRIIDELQQDELINDLVKELKLRN